MTLKYRKEIDGLRSLAVIPVILFHAGFSLFGGGYTGVDIFFVISGYLITSLIVIEKEQNQFTITKFYERRARRILPALFFVVIATIPFAYLSMAPEKLEEFFNSVISIPIFLSNFLFWSESSYFATVAEEKPLLHTWSLAVEEQYYLLFPIFLMMFWKLGKKFLIISISFIALISILLAQFGANLKPSTPFIDEVLRFTAVPDYAFFLSPTRAWELLFGSLTAFYLLSEKKYSIYSNQIFSIIGFILIFVSFFFFDKTTPFPSFYTLIPVVGTVLLIIFTIEGTLVHKILTNPILVFIGLISYSVYLWHVPIFSFTRLFTLGHPSNLTFLILILLSFVLGYLSWKYIEAPFRNRKLFTRNKIFQMSLFFGVSILSIGLLGRMSNGFEGRFTQDQINAIQPEKFSNQACKWSYPISGYPKVEVCELGDPNTKENPIIFYGDSHVDALTTTLNEKLLVENKKAIKIYNNYCEPIVGLYRSGFLNRSIKNQCGQAHNLLMRYLKKQNPQFIVILNRWTFRMYPIDNLITELTFDNQEGGKEYIKNHHAFYAGEEDGFSSHASAKRSVIENFIDNFLSMGLKVKLIYPIPEAGWNVSKYNMNKLIFGQEIPNVISTDYLLYKKRHRFILDVLDNIGINENLERIKPEEIFCDTYIQDRCVVQYNKTPLYYDADHLSNIGAAYIIDEILGTE